MIDLEKMIRDKQDQLRGRPEDWIDRVMEWMRAPIGWHHYLIAFIAFVAGYWALWMCGM